MRTPLRKSSAPLLFLAALLACRPAAPPPAVDSVVTTPPVRAFRVIGTEPFWGIRIDSTGIRFSTPEDTAGRRFPLVVPVSSGDTLRWVGVAERDSFDISIWGATCSDGMSDQVYAFAAAVRIAGTDYRGCARE
jgi:uncharacterized membrane protein